MSSTLWHKTMRTPATGLPGYAASLHSAVTAPNAAAQGTGASFAGTTVVVAAAEAAVAGVRHIDLLGPPPRGAPV